MSNIAIITARGGSKRIPRKNIKPFLGQPIISYSIQAALEAGCFDEVMVSTDDAEIAEIAQAVGAKVPFFRSPENANDFAGTIEVLVEVIEAYAHRGVEFDHLCCIYPTAPFVTPARLKTAMTTLQVEQADCVLPVVQYSYPVQRSLKIQDGRAVMVWPENYLARSQDLEPIYHDAGQFYAMNTRSMLAQRKLFAPNTIPLLLPETEVQDIDNEEDWTLAELKYRFLTQAKI